jgi:hypothetical protein
MGVVFGELLGFGAGLVGVCCLSGRARLSSLGWYGGRVMGLARGRRLRRMSGRLMRKTLGQLRALGTVNVETTDGGNGKRMGDRSTRKLNGETPMLDTKKANNWAAMVHSRRWCGWLDILDRKFHWHSKKVCRSHRLQSIHEFSHPPSTA